MSTDGAVREVPGLGPVAGDEGAVETPRPALKLPDKPSIAVLAFTNLSGDPQQEDWADGIVDDIITELSRFSELFVIAAILVSNTRAERSMSARSDAS